MLMKKLMEAEGLNPNSLSAATKNKTKQPQIHRFIAGVSKEPKRSTLAHVATYFRVPVEAFFDPHVADEVHRDRFGDKETPAATSLTRTNRTVALIAEMAEKMSAYQQEQLLSAAEALSGPLGSRLVMSFAVVGPRAPAPSESPARDAKKLV